MTTQTKAKGTKFFNEGTQNQQILANYWGNGKSFTSDDLVMDLDIVSPGARLTELREEGFDGAEWFCCCCVHNKLYQYL